MKSEAQEVIRAAGAAAEAAPVVGGDKYHSTTLEAAADAAWVIAFRKAIAIVDGARLIEAHPIGPLFHAGWMGCLVHLRDQMLIAQNYMPATSVSPALSAPTAQIPPPSAVAPPRTK